MLFNLDECTTATAYRLLSATITPRPIAWVTTLAADGTPNAAPFSFFNIMGHNPPTIAIGLVRQANGQAKDTAANIMATQEFVVNLVSEAQVLAMNATSAAFAPDVNELAEGHIATRTAVHVAPPLIADSPVSFECVSQATVVTGPNQMVVIGRVLAIHVADAYIQDAQKGYVDTQALNLVSRLHGNWYGHHPETFALDRP
ncbi:MAG: flavin reductase family protein [Neisseriaceae bacterium]|nr:flavin reductase family protein [Neisseriaceae bacterium]MBP6863119.1 flavin reductase family protein [Neisseriaceae bacterium]